MPRVAVTAAATPSRNRYSPYSARVFSATAMNPRTSRLSSAAIGVDRQRRDRAGERVRVTDGNEQTRDAGINDLAAAPDVGRDHGHAHRGRLHRGARKSFAVRREYEDVHPRVQAVDVVAAP